MTTQQSDALGYAICLDARGFFAEATELRRLHESNQELLALLKECIHFVEYDPKNVIGKQAKAAIAKAERTT